MLNSRPMKIFEAVQAESKRLIEEADEKIATLEQQLSEKDDKIADWERQFDEAMLNMKAS